MFFHQRFVPGLAIASYLVGDEKSKQVAVYWSKCGIAVDSWGGVALAVVRSIKSEASKVWPVIGHWFALLRCWRMSDFSNRCL